jgi:hypothetical protein
MGFHLEINFIELIQQFTLGIIRFVLYWLS